MSLSFLRKKSIVGLDMGSSHIRAVELLPAQSGWEIGNMAAIETPADAIRDGVVVDPQSVGMAIRQLLREAHIGSNAANIAVGGGTVVVRTVQMPSMSEATLRKSIKFEAGRYVPSSVEDSYIEFEILGKSEDGQMDVLIVAAPKDVISSRVAACEQAGLEVEAVDVEMFAAYRGLVEVSASNDWRDKTIALVDIGASKTNMSVVRNGRFAMTRSISQGGNLLTEALGSYFKLSNLEAEEGKAQLTIKELIDDGKPKENPPLRVIQPHVDDLVREMRRSLNYYQSQLNDADQGGHVDLILLTGGGSKLRGLDEYMSHKLGVSANTLGAFSGPHMQAPESAETGAGEEWGLAIGLALRSDPAWLKNAA
ncbi:MAG: type IV pilus assembly protein PilM [Armatimonadetes bacterium]|nr:MAG: type IV pilus assembly protein PilM [Armatimonadota bacterium]MCK6631101.1 type IV pilus assembly protein PilM [Fimbriimonadaceae bacterium]MBL1152007.1 type IV pilus assembly protein PilM [Armatimonadota bacterium]NOG38667.1 type IV pilus assembly protein PilM [Armatimonadota bacterium]NUM37627.1 type IV pilus assembly protein PilM [Armatimonadota bacterium]